MTTESPAAKVVAGVDTHADTHHVAVLDAATGGILGDKKFPTGRAGYAALVAFVCAFGQVMRFGVEGTNSYGAGLARHLRTAGHTVVEVVRPNRAERRLRGKSDPLDAITAARTALAPDRLPTPKNSDGAVEAIRVLLTTRRSAVKARTSAMQQICSILVSAPDTLRQQYEPLPATTRLERLRRLRPCTDPTDVHAITSRCLKQLATRYGDLVREIETIDASLRQAITDHAPALLAAHGVGVVTAATLLVTAGDNPDRVTSEAGLAALCGVSPIPASSGKTNRHRLNRGGDRQANCAIHQIALVRMSTDERTQACKYEGVAYDVKRLDRNGVWRVVGTITGTEYRDVLPNWRRLTTSTRYSFTVREATGEAAGTIMEASAACRNGNCRIIGGNRSVVVQPGAELEATWENEVPLAPSSAERRDLNVNIILTKAGVSAGNYDLGMTTIRCDNLGDSRATEGCRIMGPTPVFSMLDSGPSMLRHLRAAKAAGLPGFVGGRQLTRETDPQEIRWNREYSCGRVTGPRPSGLDCDEYPFASTSHVRSAPGMNKVTFSWCGIRDAGIVTDPPTGTNNISSVCLLSSSENRRAGAKLGWFYVKSRVLNRDLFWVSVDAP